MPRNLALVTLLCLLAATPAPAGDLVLRDGGIVFADGSVQTTAARPRKFFKTRSPVFGGGALTACGGGFHMASVWELASLAGLQYDTVRGDDLADSGAGPPAQGAGWIRTGGTASAADSAGVGNCNAWTTSGDTAFGTQGGVNTLFADVPATPWFLVTASCDTPRKVWCVED